MKTQQAVSSSRILDLLADAVKRYRHEGERGTDWTMLNMSSDERVAFDLFLVRMGDALAWEPGTFEHRFRTRVKAMATHTPASAVLAEGKAG